MSIHSEHPFAAAPSERDPLRRFRGRLAQPVTLWCAGDGADRAGWTVSSLLVVDGRPAELLGVLDEEADVREVIDRTGRVAVSLLDWERRGLADAFAGLAPAPGGVFRLGAWVSSAWGPVLDGCPAWLGAEITAADARVGFGIMIRARVAHVEVASGEPELLAHVRGQYRRLGAS